MDSSADITLRVHAGRPGDLLRLARHRSGLSQRELAELAGTSQPAVAGYESGRVQPDLATLRRLLTACGFTLQFHAEPLHPDDVRRLREAVTADAAERVKTNRAATRLAAEAARARGAGRVRRLVSDA